MSGLNQKSAFTQVGYKYDEAFDEFIFADGLPFGVKVGGIVMAFCFCDICDYNDECKHYRKVVVCPYIKTEE